MHTGIFNEILQGTLVLANIKRVFGCMIFGLGMALEFAC
jgi:hypothetical protein